MSWQPGTESSGQAMIGTGSAIPSALMDLLMVDGIVPGSAPSYELCKKIYTEHPLGAKMAEAPIDMAQSQRRELEIPGAPQDELIEAFEREWKATGSAGADSLIKNVAVLSRVYGLASVAVLCDEIEPNKPIPMEKVHELDLSYNILDPLNTSGSLILEQDPNKPDFLKPHSITVNGKPYHSSRAAILLTGQPVYIEWSNSAFGFVGRSVFQRTLYPLKGFIQSMVTDNSITEKAGLLVAKLQAPGSIADQRTRSFFGFKREAIKGAKTGNVVSIGIQEDIQSLDLKNLRDAAEFARNNILKNIATGCPMPASLINQDTLAEGFGEGSEDAKQIARYIDGYRMEIDPIYRWFDQIVMRRAWSPDFYKSIQRKYSKYRKVDYETAFYDWKNSFKAVWPNLLAEPDSEKIKVDDIVVKGAVACFEVLSPILDPQNRAVAAEWLADVMNERDLMFSSPLLLDVEALAAYEPPAPALPTEKEPTNTPETYRDSQVSVIRKGKL